MDDYVSKYSGEEADALLDKVKLLNADIQEYDLQLEDSWVSSSKAKYCRDNDGIVHIRFYLEIKSGYIGFKNIGYLHEGFRPNDYVYGTAFSSKESIDLIGIAIQPDGLIIAYSRGENSSNCLGSLSFKL